MKNFIKKILVPHFFLRLWRNIKDEREERKWRKRGCPAPPPHSIKAKTIIEYQKKLRYNLLIETGTFMGEMVEVQKRRFDKVISVELGEDLFKGAKEKFKKDQNVTIVQGDSGKVLPKILDSVSEPAIFWLDGHYSSGVTAKGDKECPIFEEIDAIFDSEKLNHALLIDDARCFVGEGDYPTIDELTGYIKNKNQDYQVEVKNDIIRYVVLN